MDRLQYVNKITTPRDLSPDDLHEEIRRQRAFITEQLPEPPGFNLIEGPWNPEETGPPDDDPDDTEPKSQRPAA